MFNKPTRRYSNVKIRFVFIRITHVCNLFHHSTACGTTDLSSAGDILMTKCEIIKAVLINLFLLLHALFVFVVVILGGYNSLVGSLVAGLLIGIIETFSGFFISPHLKEAIYFIIFIFILIFRPTGLLGRS